MTALTGSVSRALPGGVAPIHVSVPAGGATVDVLLPATTWRFAPGDRVAVTFRTTDSQFSGSSTPASFVLAAASPLVLPRLTTSATAASVGLPGRAVLDRILLLLAIAVILLLGATTVGLLRRRDARRAEVAGSVAGAGAAEGTRPRCRSWA